MEIAFSIILCIHIIGGVVGLLSGSFNMFTRKGHRLHRLIGRVFTWSMLSAGFSAIILSQWHPNVFLCMVGVFTIYMISTGNRYLRLKGFLNGQKPTLLDWCLTIVMLIGIVYFIWIGVYHIIHNTYFGFVLITFACFSLVFVIADFRNYLGLTRIKNYWLLAHLQRMVGAYIASTTAFIVVNSSFLPTLVPGFVYWLLPSFLLTPLIIKWSRKVEVKVKPKL